MSEKLRLRLLDELDQLEIIDPHTHINPHAPASQTLADLLGYHYYTELAHSSGLARQRIEQPGLEPREKVRLLVKHLAPLDNTVQYSWLVEMAQQFFEFEHDRVTQANWESLYEKASQKMGAPDWSTQVLARSRLKGVFLTNDFDDSLEGFDTEIYIPCLRTDDLVFHLAKPQVRTRLAKATGIDPVNIGQLRAAIAGLFEHFTSKGARACAISLPPDFAPSKVNEQTATKGLLQILKVGEQADVDSRRILSSFVFWTIAEMCAQYHLPFDLMIGVNRAVYTSGVFQGQDLYDSRVSLIQYAEIFNAFPQVTFPISVLASVTNQELVSYAWLFPNVVTNGHWWYSNTPSKIEHDLSHRLEAVPRTKQIGYYSDMYKLEFALPKFGMYKKMLAKVLAERFVVDYRWSEERAVALGTQILRDNTEQIFPRR